MEFEQGKILQESPNGHMYNVNRKKRMEGLQYIGISNKELSVKPLRELGEACSSQFCKKSALRNCSSFKDNTRNEIFNLFWKMTWEQKRMYVISLTSSSETKINSTEKSRRTQTIQYFLRHNSIRLQVCRNMFYSTLGIKEKMVRNWINGASKHGMQETPEKTSNLRKSAKRSSVTGKRNEERRIFLQKFLDELPKMESHYCRRDSQKLYFESDFSTYQEIYQLYVAECDSKKENGNIKLSYPMFAQLLKELNYSIFKPRKDQCDICVSHKVSNLSDEDYKKHREQIQKMREKKYNDITNGKSGICAVICMDVQAVKLISQLKASAAYYKMKLQLHNFTIYNILTHESDNYVWDETDGCLVASVFATCIIKHLRKIQTQSPEIHHVIIYSDGCFYQNRNVILSNALLAFTMETQITIEQKFLISGHTQMECDSSHSLIERKIKNKEINLPSQFVQLIKEARKVPAPLQAHHLHYDYFLNFENMPKRYSSIRPGRSIGDFTVNMLRALAYDPSGSIYFKTDITDDYQLLPHRSKSAIKDIPPDSLYKEKIAITKKKWDHLQNLKKFLPADCHLFYDNLPYKN